MSYMVWIWEISFFPYSKIANIHEWILIKNAERNSFLAEFQAKEVLLSTFLNDRTKGVDIGSKENINLILATLSYHNFCEHETGS